MTNPNHQPTVLDDEEQTLTDSFETGEWVAAGLSAATPFLVADFEPVRHSQKALTLAVDGGCVNRT